MRALVKILVSAVVLLLVSVIVMFMYSSEIGPIGDNSGKLVNNTACEEAQQKLDDGEIDELPNRCETGLEPEPPKISAT